MKYKQYRQHLLVKKPDEFYEYNTDKGEPATFYQAQPDNSNEVFNAFYFGAFLGIFISFLLHILL